MTLPSARLIGMFVCDCAVLSVVVVYVNFLKMCV